MLWIFAEWQDYTDHNDRENYKLQVTTTRIPKNNFTKNVQSHNGMEENEFKKLINT